MKLIIEYDPWVDRANAERAANALSTLGIPAEIREVYPHAHSGGAPESTKPIVFQQ